MTAIKSLDLSKMSKEDTKLLNKLYVDYKQEYVEMLDQISKKVSSIYWWATPLSSRNWYLSDTWKEICIAMVGIQRIQQNRQIEKVYCPSKEIAVTIEKYCKEIRRAITCEYAKEISIVSLRKQFIAFGQCVQKELDRYRKINGIFKTKVPPFLEKDQEIIVIDTYVKASEVDVEGYKEKYLKNILQYSKEPIYFMPHLVLNTRVPVHVIAKRLQHAKQYPCFFKEQFLQVCDYYKLLLYPFLCVLFSLSKKTVGGIDVTAIIRKDLVKGITSYNAIEGILKFFAVHRMKKQGVKIKQLIGWYEGQPSSNGLFLGYRQAYPKGSSVGYIGYAIDQNNINVAPTKEQAHKKAVPQIMTVIAGCFQWIPNQFVKTNVRVVPALRLQHIHSNCVRQNGGQKSILVALSYEKETSTEILKWIQATENFYNKNGIMILIKNHPYNHKMTLRQYGIETLNCEYQFVQGEFCDAIDKAALVITAQSNAGYETALYGKPILFLNFPTQLNINYMPKEWEGTRYEVVYDSKELEQAIDKYLCMNLEEVALEDEYFYMMASLETVSRLFV